MKKNIGKLDRNIRLILAVILGGLSAMDVWSGAVTWIMGILSLVMIITAFVGFCPLYLPFRLRTNQKDN